MSFELMTDKQIVEQLGKNFDLLRRYKTIQDKEVFARGGTNSSALNKFRGNKGNITVENLVKLLRGIGELDRLETLFSHPEQYSPTVGEAVTPSKRIRKAPSRDFKWKDEE
ncbi:MAG: hypothetical protein ACI9MF_002687 [Gammaproteobacteria bacterium]|jgi:hypothetical protein